MSAEGQDFAIPLLCLLPFRKGRGSARHAEGKVLHPETHGRIIPVNGAINVDDIALDFEPRRSVEEENASHATSLLKHLLCTDAGLSGRVPQAFKTQGEYCGDGGNSLIISGLERSPSIPQGDAPELGEAA